MHVLYIELMESPRVVHYFKNLVIWKSQLSHSIDKKITNTQLIEVHVNF
jgi:hypothetical protein